MVFINISLQIYSNSLQTFDNLGHVMVITNYNKLYKIALIYELMNSHTHLSHSFSIIAYILKLLKDSSKPIVFPFPHSPGVYGENR